MTDNPENEPENDNEMVQDLESAFAELDIIEVVKERDEFKDIALRVQADLPMEGKTQRRCTRVHSEQFFCNLRCVF